MRLNTRSVDIVFIGYDCFSCHLHDIFIGGLLVIFRKTIKRAHQYPESAERLNLLRQYLRKGR